MEQINALELCDPDVFPDEAVLETVLGDSYPAYRELLSLYGTLGMEWEWRYYRDGKAWLCKVRKKKKTAAWMSAWKGYMKATVYIHESQAEGLEGLGLGEETAVKIRKAKKVGKSIPCMFEIGNGGMLGDFEKVLRYKESCSTGRKKA